MGRNIHQGVKIGGKPGTSDTTSPVRTALGLEIKDAGVPDIVSSRIYNIDGKLFWNGEEITSRSGGDDRWSYRAADKGIVFRMGSVGINTPDPKSELDVNGTITAKGLRVSGLSGIPVARDGEITSAASLADLRDVSVSSAKEGALLTLVGGEWVPTNRRDLGLKHSDLIKGEDDHPQYFDAERHAAAPHAIPSLSVAGVLKATESGVEISAPLTVAGGLQFTSRGVGVLVSRDGKVQSNATSDDVVEGRKNLYLTPSRVESVGDSKYFRLDGGNASQLRSIGEIKGLDAEKVGGKRASDFAAFSHEHSHSMLTGSGADDHHSEIHSLIGEQHLTPSGLEDGLCVLIAGGKATFGRMTLRGTSGDLDASRISGLSEGEVMALRGVTSGVQDQLDAKAAVNHAHSHSQMLGRDADDHPDYFNVARLERWFDGKTSDDIKQGGKNIYLDEESLRDRLASEFLTKSGKDWPISLPAGSNADMIDGFHATELSKTGHSHSHADLTSASRDDHHPEKHSLIGGVHSIGDAEEGGILFVLQGGTVFRKLSLADLPDGIPSSKLSLPVSAMELSSLSGIKGGIQGQIDAKADDGHRHSHSSLIDAEGDAHPIYLTGERLGRILSQMTSDDIKEGVANRYFDEVAIRSVFSSSSPLNLRDGELSLSFDSDDFEERGGRLALKDKLGADSDILVSSIRVAKNIVAEEDVVARNIISSGTIRAGAIQLASEGGILSNRNGRIVGGSRLSDLSDVAEGEISEASVLMSADGSWRAISVSDLAEMIVADQEEVVPEDDSFDFPELDVAAGAFRVTQDGKVGIGTPPSDEAIAVRGSFGVTDGDFMISGRIGIGTREPREALDVFGGSIVGGTYSNVHANVLDLSSNPTAAMATLRMGTGARLQFVSGAKDASLAAVTADGSSMFFRLDEAGTRLDTSRFSVGSGGREFFSISDKGGSFGTEASNATLDVGKTFGVNDGGKSPKSWLMLRASSPAVPPTICFPSDSSLKIGTLNSYDQSAVWVERVSVESDGSLKIGGRLSVGTKDITLTMLDGEDVQIGGSGAIKLSADSPSSLGGLSKGRDGDEVLVINVSKHPIAVKHESSGSIATNRIWNPTEVTLEAGRSVSMLYDGGSSRWLVII